MIRFLTINDIKRDGFVNANLEEEYLNSAIDEVQNIYVREILGDKLYKKIDDIVNIGPMTGKYKELLDDFIKPYMKYKVLSVICVPLNFKIRNAGIVNQYSPEMNTTSLEETKYIQNFYDGKAEFFENRMQKFLIKNKKYIPEYKYCCEQITNPTDSSTYGTLYLGRRNKKYSK